jgi:hypothetical protein
MRWQCHSNVWCLVGWLNLIAQLSGNAAQTALMADLTVTLCNMVAAYNGTEPPEFTKGEKVSMQRCFWCNRLFLYGSQLRHILMQLPRLPHPCSVVAAFNTLCADNDDLCVTAFMCCKQTQRAHVLTECCECGRQHFVLLLLQVRCMEYMSVGASPPLLLTLLGTRSTSG